MHAYSQDLRDRVLRGLERGERPSDIARRLEVTRAWVYQVKNRMLRDGSRSQLPIGGHRTSRIAPFEPVVREWIGQEPDLTLAEICERLAAQLGVTIKVPALWHQLDKWNLTFKKNSARRRARARGCPGSQA